MAVHRTSNPLYNVIHKDCNENSAADMLYRGNGFIFDEEVTITGAGATILNVFKVTGTIRVLNQQAEITEVTDLTSCTAVYADVSDGVVEYDLTVDGIDLSGVPAGTYFTKDKVSSQPYSMNVADQCRILETLADKKAGRPFNVTQKNGVDTFIRFRFNGGSGVNFKMRVLFEWIPVNGGNLELAG